MAKYEEWLTDEGLTMIEGWARSGMIDEQIAERMGIGVRTLYEWKHKYPQISQSLKKGKEVVDYMVERALLNKALAGDVTAIIFWLKNRCPEKWRDKPREIVVVQERREPLTIDERETLLREMYMLAVSEQGCIPITHNIPA